MALTKPEFLDVNPLTIADEMVLSYQEKTGKILQPADIERLLINGFAYRESVIRNQINYAAIQNLVDFASAPILDYLAKLVGVTRIPPVAALCKITLTFVGNVLPIVIPAGTRIASQDNLLVFSIVEAVNVAALDASVEVDAVCLTDGVDGNGYAIGTINIIQDPQPYLTEAENSTITAGGAVEETDDQLRERIKLAPAQFSTAGSKESYKFHALGAHPSIVDVGIPAVTIPGTVNLYPLIDSGDPTPTEILDLVIAACSDEKVRPLTDTVVVESPTRINYTLTIQLTLFTSAVQADVLAKVEDQVTTFITDKRKKLGRDIISTQLVAAIMKDLEDQIYKVVLSGFADIIVSPQEFAFCTVVNTTVVGTNNG